MIYYEVTREDLMKASSFKWQKVLQTTCDTSRWLVIHAEFYRFIKVIKERVLYKRITMAEANIEIRKEVLKLTAKYPNDFPAAHELGAYSRKILADKFIAGEITINSVYDVNVMLSERIALLKAIADDKEVLLAKERERIEAERISKEIAEASRVPLQAGMLLVNKEAIGKAFIHQYPKGTKMSTVLKEIGNVVVLDYGKHSYKTCWLIKEVLAEGGLVYADDIIGKIEVEDAN